mgnify:CR=1 FL=1
MSKIAKPHHFSRDTVQRTALATDEPPGMAAAIQAQVALVPGEEASTQAVQALGLPSWFAAREQRADNGARTASTRPNRLVVRVVRSDNLPAMHSAYVCCTSYVQWVWWRGVCLYGLVWLGVATTMVCVVCVSVSVSIMLWLAVCACCLQRSRVSIEAGPQQVHDRDEPRAAPAME